MDFVLGYAPAAAAILAIPQFLPQLLKVHRTGDTTGVSWPWAMLTSVNNAAWLAYFVLSGFWSALVPASAAALLAGVLAVMLARRGRLTRRAALLIAAWPAVLIAAFIAAGRAGLGTVLTAAFVLQVAPPIWTAYRTSHPTGISRGTWLLIFGELSCWALYGFRQSDPRLLTLGETGIVASILMLARTLRMPAGRTRRERQRLILGTWLRCGQRGWRTSAPSWRSAPAGSGMPRQSGPWPRGTPAWWPWSTARSPAFSPSGRATSTGGTSLTCCSSHPAGGGAESGARSCAPP